MNDELEFHPIANVFPMMEGEVWEAFKKDIEVNGVIEPVILYKGKILDGRNRYKAATELDMECDFENYNGDDPLGFVLSHNLHRRHLDEAQRAVVATEVANLSHGTNRFQAKVDGPIGPSTEEPTVPLMTTDKAAKMLNVSPRSVKRAKKIMREAAPEVVEKVRRGDMSLNAALKTLKPEADNVVRLGVEKREQPTEKQLEVRRTKEYKELEKKYNALLIERNFLEGECKKLREEIARLKEEKLTGAAK